jgi:hypothetical protein
VVSTSEKIRLVEMRNYVARQTAFYATWLLLQEEAKFVEFLEAFPHYRLDERLTKIDEEREVLTADLHRRLHRRDFDLSRVGDEEQRENLTRRYVETADKLRQLGADFRLLERAKELATEWQDKI